MFFSFSSPTSSYARSSLSAAPPRTRADMQIPPALSQAFEAGGDVYRVTKTRLPFDLLDLGRRGHPGARCQGQERGGLQPHHHGREVMECWTTFAVREAALGRLFDEQKRNVPVRNQATIEYLLAVAEAEKRRFLSQHARKGGQAKKTDALQQEIVKLVRRDPAITEARLKDMLTSDRFSELIVEFDEETISFQPGDSKHGRLKEARISGLKDRLSRAKKSLKSR